MHAIYFHIVKHSLQFFPSIYKDLIWYILNVCPPEYIQKTILNQLTVSECFLFYGCQTWYFVLNVIIWHFSGGGMVMWTTTHCFDLFSCNHIYIVSLCATLQTHTWTNQHSIRPAAKNTLFSCITCTGGGGGVLLFKLFANMTFPAGCRNVSC